MEKYSIFEKTDWKNISEELENNFALWENELDNLLYFATRRGNIHATLVLLSHGADVNASISYANKSTPLHGACWGGHVECMKLLIHHGADITLRNEYGETPADNAKIKGVIKQFENILKEYKMGSPIGEVPLTFISKKESSKLKIVDRDHTKTKEVPRIIVNSKGERIVRVVCISDTHNRHARLNIPEGDILIHSGDFTNRGGETEIFSFSDWFCNQPHKHKVLVTGNHERDFRKYGKDTIASWFPGVHYLEDDTIEIEGLRICGTPWMNMGSFYADGADRRNIFKNTIPSGDTIHILVTHMPPFRVMDYAFQKSALEDISMCIYCKEVHTGFRHWGGIELLNRVLQVKPLMHQFGHVHDTVGFASIAGTKTLFVNAAQDLLSGRGVPPVIEFVV